ncbi:MAG: 16S rRNA (cytosine(1402)-N(4))-methyltransferase RsmH [Ardenticatenaceae bacterium]|nr:16S rRNA (cytosine(1402)-N(4))-methyltransferase RsmH [Ardenticatenaceae bacterium]
MTDSHIPVLYHEVLELLQPQPNGRYLDGTVGAGGHTRGILEASAPNGQVVAFDRDPAAIAFAQQQLAEFGSRVTFINDSYTAMRGHGQFDGILLDLGLSSRQLADSQRGFSFLREGPLDMRFDTTQGPTAADLINNLTETELADIFWRYGEERRSRQWAKVIVAHRPLTTTIQLADLIANQVKKRGRIHPATQIFQALRIAVNNELEVVASGVKIAVELLRVNGRLAVISFHSLEDRFVKQYFRELSRDCICPPEQPICTCNRQPIARLITRKAVQASADEIAANPRSRSARLRVVEKVGNL